jgi:hypothetical protein
VILCREEKKRKNLKESGASPSENKNRIKQVKEGRYYSDAEMKKKGVSQWLLFDYDHGRRVRMRVRSGDE